MYRKISSRLTKPNRTKNKNISNPFSIKLNYLKALVREARGFCFGNIKEKDYGIESGKCTMG